MVEYLFKISIKFILKIPFLHGKGFKLKVSPDLFFIYGTVPYRTVTYSHKQLYVLFNSIMKRVKGYSRTLLKNYRNPQKYGTF